MNSDQFKTRMGNKGGAYLTHSSAFSTAINQMSNVITPVHLMSLGAVIYLDCCNKRCGWLSLSGPLSRPEGFEENIPFKRWGNENIFSYLGR